MADVEKIYIGDASGDSHLIVDNSVKIVTWADGTDEEVAAMLQAHYDGIIDIHDYWSVGDERTVQLSAMSTSTGIDETHAAQPVVFVLSNAGGKYLSDGATECAFQVDQKNSLNEKGKINVNTTNDGGWKNAPRRTWCNSVYKNAIPSTLRDIFKEFINQSGASDDTSSWSGVENTVDTFALRAEIEIFGSITYSVSGEGTQVDWYKTSSNRNKVLNGSYFWWWERSPYSMYRFCQVSNTGEARQSYPTDGIGIAPFGCI